jgi:hypothetical protein
MPYQRLAIAVLADWVQVRKTIQMVQKGSAEAALLHAEATGLRDEYQRLIDAAVEFRKPVPKPFPVTPRRPLTP